jgi:hypothetical protein
MHNAQGQTPPNLGVYKMTLLQLSKEKALDAVFVNRPNLPTDWDVVMEADFNDREGFGDDFVVSDPYYGYSNDYVCGTLRSLQGQLYSMAEVAINKVHDLAAKHRTNGNTNFTTEGE